MTQPPDDDDSCESTPALSQAPLTLIDEPQKSPDEIVSQGERILRLLEDPDVQEAHQALLRTYFEEFVRVPAGEFDQMAYIHAKINASLDMLSQFDQFVAEARSVVAARDNERETLEDFQYGRS